MPLGGGGGPLFTCGGGGGGGWIVTIGREVRLLLETIVLTSLSLSSSLSVYSELLHERERRRRFDEEIPIRSAVRLISS